MHDVAIAIPCLDSALTLAETLHSLIQGDNLEGATIILLDGGSSDFTKHIFDYFSRIAPKFNFVYRDFCGVHPAERVNILLEEASHEFIFLCHSDDIYIPAAMHDMLLSIKVGSMWAIGSQCGFFQHPIDSALKRASPYAGSHCTHPLGPDEIFCEMPFWWSISWNTILLRASKIVASGIKLNPIRYPFLNDYAFNWELAKLGRLENVDYFSVLTRHRASGDGPVNLNCLASEGTKLRALIQREIGLEMFLGKHLTFILRSINYSYGGWSLARFIYPRSHYLSLATKLREFSQTSSRFAHFEILGESLAKLF